MNFLIAPLLALFSKIPGLLGDYFSKRLEVKTAELDLERQIVLEKYKLAGETARAEADMARSILDATGRRFKYFTFVMWFGPFMVGCVKPAWSLEIFNNLKLMPDWYVQSCMTIMFTVWGIQVASPVISTIFSNLTSYLADRRTDKIELQRVSGDAYKKAYFDAMRVVKGVVTPQDVAIGNKVLDSLAATGEYSVGDK